MKFKESFLIALAVIVILLVASVNATLNGGLVFIIVAAVVGFFTWLFGSEHVRSIALNWGCVVGGAFWMVCFVYRVDRAVTFLRKGLQERKIRSALEEE